jgi:hypothetical protein
MKEPTKKLRNQAVRYRKARGEFYQSMRVYLHDCIPMEDDAFWDYLEYFAKEIRSRMSYDSGNPIKSASHNTILYIKGRVDSDRPLTRWLTAAKFLAAYKRWSGKLSEKCWEMPGVEKSDDSYGDWTDALPLGGRKFVTGILEDDIANYKQVDKALDEHSPTLKKLIQDGENYIEMKFEDELIEHFSYAAREEAEPKEEF